jgi:hypothetical protein
MGMAFLNIYMINYKEIGKWPIFPAVILIVFGFMIYSGKSPIKLLFGVVPSIIPVVLIVIGIVFILKSVIKR